MWVALLLGPFALLTGCGPVWLLHYDEAVRQARRVEQPLLMLYKDSFDPESSRVESLLNAPAVQNLLGGRTLCKLTTQFPPDRRVVAQYGAAHAPAIILVHVDGTYHALTEGFSEASLRTFLLESNPPGNRPQINPQVPRTIDIADWDGDYDEAAKRAKRQNRRLIIVYKWWLDADSTELLSLIHTHPELARFFAESVNCVLDYAFAPNREHVKQFGVSKPPAVIVVNRDGTFHSTEGLPSAGELARFLAASESAGQVPGGTFADRRRARADYHWYTDFNRALAHARNKQANLLVFFSSLYSEDSFQLAATLDRSEISSLFKDTVNCRLYASVPADRQIMAAYQIDAAPALLMIRPDDTYHVHRGNASDGQIRALVVAANQRGTPGP